jgi:hypothetical protein
MGIFDFFKKKNDSIDETWNNTTTMTGEEKTDEPMVAPEPEAPVSEPESTGDTSQDTGSDSGSGVDNE